MGKPRPYYGFSCGLHGAQFYEIWRHVTGSHPTERRLMFGTHMSSKSLRGLDVRRPKRTLGVGQVRGLYTTVRQHCGDDDMIFPVVHFNSVSPATIDAELLLVDHNVHQPECGAEAAIHNCRLFSGFQINKALPSEKYLKWFQENHLWSKRYEIILQVDFQILDFAENSPEKLAEMMKVYWGTVDYFLFDVSCGTGAPFDANLARPYLQALARECPWAGLAVAGGLGPKTMHLVEPLVDEFPHLSVDAESGLRDADDNFVVDLAIEFYERSADLFEK